MKRGWKLLAAIAFIVLAWATGTSRLNGHEFSFLDRYHLQVKMIEVQSGAYSERRYYYFFDSENGIEVLPAMERELGSSKGHVRRKSGGPAKIVSFSRSSGGRLVWASYHSSNNPMMLSTREGTFRTPPGGCTVWISREPTWLERQLDAIKGVLHWR